MLLELRTVSRKTPSDGRLEISEATARRLALLGGEMPVRTAQAQGVGLLTTMACTCRKAGGAHVHHFLQSDVLRGLVPEARVRVELDEAQGAVNVSENG